MCGTPGGTFVFVFHSCLAVKHCLQWLTEKRLFNVNGALTRLAIRREGERERGREHCHKGERRLELLRIQVDEHKTAARPHKPRLGSAAIRV